MEQKLEQKIQMAAEKLATLRDADLKAYYRNPVEDRQKKGLVWLDKLDIRRAADELKALENKLSLYKMEHYGGRPLTATYAPRGGKSLAQRARDEANRYGLQPMDLGFRKSRSRSPARKRKSRSRSPARKRKSPARKRKSPARKRKSRSRSRK
jgi:hypothetical protein